MNLVLLGCLLVISSFLFAQDGLEKEKEPKVVFGVYMGVNHSLNNIEEEDIYLTINTAPGFEIGLTSDFQLTNRNSISFRSIMSFNDKSIYLLPNNDLYEYFPMAIDFMAHHKYSLSKKENGVYVLFGPKYRRTLVKTLDAGNFNHPKQMLAIDFGVGFNSLFEKFVFSPELRYSYDLISLRNLAFPNHHITLAINFR